MVDMSGRRSALPGWLSEIGARDPAGAGGQRVRVLRAALPVGGRVGAPAIGPNVMDWGTITSLTLPADNGTWAIALVTSSKDTALRPLRETGRWEAVVRGLPLVAHWLDGTPIEDGVQVMAHLEDRYRGFVADGRPVATGVVAVADSWACSNPANGRGASIGMLHAVTLRDQFREVGLDDPAAFAEAFHAATARTVEPWYRATLATDRYRLAEIESGVRGGTYDPQDSQYQLGKALGAAAGQDPDCLRAYLDIWLVLRTPRGGLRPARAARQDPAARIWLARRGTAGPRPGTAPRAGVWPVDLIAHAGPRAGRRRPHWAGWTSTGSASSTTSRGMGRRSCCCTASRTPRRWRHRCRPRRGRIPGHRPGPARIRALR